MPTRDTASEGSGLRLVAAASVATIALCGVGAVVTLLAGGLDRPTLAAAVARLRLAGRRGFLGDAVVLGSVFGLGLYAARTARRTETPYWRS